MAQGNGLANFFARQRIDEYLYETIVQMIPGAKLLSQSNHKLDAGEGRYTFDSKGVKLIHPEGFSFQISKHRRFSPKAEKLVREIVDECFDNKIHMSSHWRETANGITNTAVAGFVAPDSEVSKSVQNAITLYASWSSQTYEGARISHTIGVNSRLASPVDSFCLENLESLKRFYASTCPLSDYRNSDEAKLLGSGANSLLLLDAHSYIHGVEHVPQLAPEALGRVKAPLAFSHIARWTNRNTRVAVTLTRNGEILVFSDNVLQFAKRRGAWRYFPHGSLITDIISLTEFNVKKRELLEALHLTALDVSFTRGGACLGIIESREQLSQLTGDECRIEKKPLYKQILKCRNFMDLPRSLRVELCAIDGATIVDKYGEILCVGAILNKHGSNFEGGGGRTAVARAISKFGMGIKVSNDGNIVAFPHNWSKGKEIQWA